MPRYSVWRETTETDKIYFEAKDLDDAKRIIQELNNYDLDLDDVEGLFIKNKNTFQEIEVSTLEQEGE